MRQARVSSAVLYKLTIASTNGTDHGLDDVERAGLEVKGYVRD